jgi:hypothetical protein
MKSIFLFLSGVAITIIILPVVVFILGMRSVTSEQVITSNKGGFINDL